MLRSIYRDELPIPHRPLQVKVPADRAEGVPFTAKCGNEPRFGLEGVEEARERVLCSRRGRDSLVGEPSICRERLEQPDYGVEKRDGLKDVRNNLK